VRLTATGRRRLDRVFDALGAEREHLLTQLGEPPPRARGPTAAGGRA
jgi:hypothetical protein